MTTDAGVDVPIVWRGRRTRAFVPALLSTRDLSLGVHTVASTSRARADIEHAAEGLRDDLWPLTRLMLRTEGIASSHIEGVIAPVIDVVLAEHSTLGRHTAGAWVAANLAAVDQALTTAHDHPLTSQQLCEWHRTLMAGSPTPERFVGSFRTEQGWIGGTSPFDAHLVTPPPERIDTLMDDLIGFVNRDDVDPVAQAAIGHAQFEIIHPFGDGNGRLGRVLIAWILTRRLALVAPPPVSTAIAADVGGYTSGLTLFRLGDHERWGRWFADAVSRAARAQQELAAAVDDLGRAWRVRLGAPRTDSKRLRVNATAWRVLDLVSRRLVLTARSVAFDLDVTPKTASTALRELADDGILTAIVDERDVRRGRPEHLYVADELLGLVGASPRRS